MVQGPHSSGNFDIYTYIYIKCIISNNNEIIIIIIINTKEKEGKYYLQFVILSFKYVKQKKKISSNHRQYQMLL